MNIKKKGKEKSNAFSLRMIFEDEIIVAKLLLLWYTDRLTDDHQITSGNSRIHKSVSLYGTAIAKRSLMFVSISLQIALHLTFN